MERDLKSRIIGLYRRIKKNRISVRIRDVDNRIQENLKISSYIVRQNNNQLTSMEEMKKLCVSSKYSIDNVGESCANINKLIEENLKTNREYANILEVILSEGRDAIQIADEIRKQNNIHDNRIRQLELCVLHLMKQAGVSVESLAVEASDSQQPAIANDIRFLKLELTKSSVIKSIDRIRALTELQCRDVEFLEHTLIPELGLAQEDWSFPPEIAHLSGKGLHLLQLPCQLAPLLAWLADNARGIECYLEIGVRWGGMFILISEWLRRFSPELRKVIALDPAEMSPLIREYADYISTIDGDRRLEVRYEKEYSTSVVAKDLVLNLRPDFVFIDGDHRYEGVSHDYELVRDRAKMLMFHDICASSWPGVGRLWREVLTQNSKTHSAVEFTKQYQSGDGGGMGLGVVKVRR
ncbi:class I SAM-dependent methyltransferase [Agrobacterium sp. 22-211-1]